MCEEINKQISQTEFARTHDRNIKIRRIRAYGIVQGVGFRPTVARHAAAAGITGTVSNRGPFVEIFAEGTESELTKFRKLLTTKPPKRASILKLMEADSDSFSALAVLPETVAPAQLSDVTEASGTAADISRHFPDFRIIESEKTSGEIFISPDIAMCQECEAELLDPKNRRYLHPFINCTCCGPRLSILDSLPYDRERTSMKKFTMCPDCAREYTTPADRRYDAQPVCCPHCGPEYYLLNTGANVLDGNKTESAGLYGDAAIRQARKVILDGGIVAVKGIGGFHLCCDATSESTVQRIRARKTRPAKPFAVMVRNRAAAEDICEISPEEAEILDGHQKPILLLKKRQPDRTAENGGKNESAEKKFADSVAPENPYLGVMLPYAPIQRLLFDYPDGLNMPDVLVMTSGNHAGAPICRDDESALQELGGIADCILSNNRDIRLRADDSVMQFFRGEPLMIRRSRGYAPLPYSVSGLSSEERASGQTADAKSAPANGSTVSMLSQDSSGEKKQVLAIGGELKNTFCFGIGDFFYPGSYVGDLTDLRTCDALRESVLRMETLLEAKPQVIACDLHPRYNSTTVAEELAEERGLSLVRIQHHYAHIASCMAENDYHEKVIGLAMDGTGYGTDGSVWGGELLLSDFHGFTRVASIKPFLQIGGDVSSREGWRIAVSMIYSLEKAANRLDSDIGSFVARNRTEEIARKLGLADQNTLRGQFMLHDRNLNSITSTSCGRLFDAVSAILGIRCVSSYEGEAAIQLMYHAEDSCFAGIRWEMLAAQALPILAEETDLPVSGACPTGTAKSAEIASAVHFEANPLLKSAVRLLQEFLSFKEKVTQREETLGQSSVLEDESIWEDTEAEVANEVDSEDERQIVRTDLLFRFILEKRLQQQSGAHRSDAAFGSADVSSNAAGSTEIGVNELAWFFHLGLAYLLSEAASEISEESGIRTAALSGGTFQNTLLLGATEDILKSKGIQVLRHHLIPPNDGGIALGQAAIAGAALSFRS